jgi:hypothetical protein
LTGGVCVPCPKRAGSILRTAVDYSHFGLKT